MLCSSIRISKMSWLGILSMMSWLKQGKLKSLPNAVTKDWSKSDFRLRNRKSTEFTYFSNPTACVSLQRYSNYAWFIELMFLLWVIIKAYTYGSIREEHSLHWRRCFWRRDFRKTRNKIRRVDRVLCRYQSCFSKSEVPALTYDYLSFRNKACHGFHSKHDWYWNMGHAQELDQFQTRECDEHFERKLGHFKIQSFPRTQSQSQFYQVQLQILLRPPSEVL